MGPQATSAQTLLREAQVLSRRQSNKSAGKRNRQNPTTKVEERQRRLRPKSDDKTRKGSDGQALKHAQGREPRPKGGRGHRPPARG